MNAKPQGQDENSGQFEEQRKIRWFCLVLPVQWALACVRNVERSGTDRIEPKGAGGGHVLLKWLPFPPILREPGGREGLARTLYESAVESV